ncbi:MAG: polysaccharide biosynthesis/export family protein [Pseudomonadota bacterium]|nr:polysaccharide biosynthesis/export family protein [Pseudomonadota bacterium]
MTSRDFARVVGLAALVGLALVAQGCGDRRYERSDQARRAVAAPVAVPVEPAQQQLPVVTQAPAPAPLPQAVQPAPQPFQVQAAPPVATPPQVEPAAPVAPAETGPQVTIQPLPAGATATGVPERRVVATGSGFGPSALDDGRPVIDVDTIPDDVAQKLEQYRLGPGDRLQIKVFGQEDISGEFEISAAGELSVPLIGQITAENLTLGELAQVITKSLNADYIVDPKVSIEVTNYRPFFILGQVGKPGSYKYQPGLNARMAVAVGGGYTRRAREEPITIYRVSAAGELVRFRVDQNAIVLPGDTLEVHRRLF